MFILRLFSLSGKSFFSSIGGCFLYPNLFPFREKVFWSLPTLKTLSKAFKKSHRPFPAIEIFPKPLQNLSKPSQDLWKPLQNLSKTFQNSQNPLRAGLWDLFPAFSGPRLLRVLFSLLGLIWVSSGASGPLPSLFWALGPLWAFSRLLDLFPGSGPKPLQDLSKTSQNSQKNRKGKSLRSSP